ncbi:MAG: NUDIX hydrolase [Candidatus Binatia bacterium]|nr:MAG: NUDIX hydrolase [Candidatus Binatia bacterium]
MADAVQPFPSATVVLLRDGENGCEVLLVRRSKKLDFHGGAWVFPGGRIDPADYAAAGSEAVVDAARFAAAREAREETGLDIDTEHLVLVSRWITPERLPKRFDTYFFATAAPEGVVRVDGGEISTHRWFGAAEALEAHRKGEIELPPPTFVTLHRLVPFRTSREALEKLARGPVETFLPRLWPTDGGACIVYPGDAAYDDGDLARSGPRHRLWVVGSDWQYERTP